MSRIDDQYMAQEFWDSLNSRERHELMEEYYPNKSHLMDVSEMWRGLDLKDRVDIWKREIGYDEVNV